MTDQWLPYQVFKQEREGAPFRNVGSVHAADAEMALLAARDVFARRPACNSLWVVPAAVILARTAEELVGERGRKGAGAVSYTHLDVYKRQGYGIE